MSPARASKVCAEPGCGALTGRQARCLVHAHRGHQARWGTDRAAQAGHKARRARILRRDPTCQLRLPGCTGVSEVCDHRVPLAAGAAAGGLDTDENCRGVCRACDRKNTSQTAHWFAGHDVPCPWSAPAEPSTRPLGAPLPAAPQREIPRVIWIA